MSDQRRRVRFRKIRGRIVPIKDKTPTTFAAIGSATGVGALGVYASAKAGYLDTREREGAAMLTKYLDKNDPKYRSQNPFHEEMPLTPPKQKILNRTKARYARIIKRTAKRKRLFSEISKGTARTGTTVTAAWAGGVLGDYLVDDKNYMADTLSQTLTGTASAGLAWKVNDAVTKAVREKKIDVDVGPFSAGKVKVEKFRVGPFPFSPKVNRLLKNGTIKNVLRKALTKLR